MLKDAAEMIMNHLQGRRPVAFADGTAGPIPATSAAPESPSTPPAVFSAPALDPEHPDPPRTSPSPGM
jgi:hypothetical protein